MASQRAVTPARHLFTGFRKYRQPFQPSRTMATEVQMPNSTLSQAYQDAHLETDATQIIPQDDSNTPPHAYKHANVEEFDPRQNPFLTTTQCMLYSFPSFEPKSFVTYPGTHLSVPMRKDLLHRAVIFEGDATRQGTANTKWRDEVRGSGKKIRPQKGTGMARLGDKKSPMLRGGGVAFGPKPRDFATGLQKRVYDLAWRIALSYRYRMGQLLVVDDEFTLNDIDPNSRARYLRDLLNHNHLGNASGRTRFVAYHKRKSFFNTLEEGNMGKHALAVDINDVDVKDLLEMGRIVVERNALEEMFIRHQSDLHMKLKFERRRGEPEATSAETSTV